MSSLSSIAWTVYVLIYMAASLVISAAVLTLPFRRSSLRPSRARTPSTGMPGTAFLDVGSQTRETCVSWQMRAEEPQDIKLSNFTTLVEVMDEVNELNDERIDLNDELNEVEEECEEELEEGCEEELEEVVRKLGALRELMKSRNSEKMRKLRNLGESHRHLRVFSEDS